MRLPSPGKTVLLLFALPTPANASIVAFKIALAQYANHMRHCMPTTMRLDNACSAYVYEHLCVTLFVFQAAARGGL